mmetsp:Transcript_29141/g.44016  ORF Transcript_29141/g.44016 Transcript_29141/m.44016 type:complete len:115 (+) Transcript_29141:69-413(+)
MGCTVSSGAQGVLLPTDPVVHGKCALQDGDDQFSGKLSCHHRHQHLHKHQHHHCQTRSGKQVKPAMRTVHLTNLREMAKFEVYDPWRGLTNRAALNPCHEPFFHGGKPGDYGFC